MFPQHRCIAYNQNKEAIEWLEKAIENGYEPAKKLLKTESNVEVIQYVKENLSLYSAEYDDGREIISECFSGYYSSVNNSFANGFVKRCIELTGGNSSETE